MLALCVSFQTHSNKLVILSEATLNEVKGAQSKDLLFSLSARKTDAPSWRLLFGAKGGESEGLNRVILS